MVPAHQGFDAVQPFRAEADLRLIVEGQFIGRDAAREVGRRYFNVAGPYLRPVFDRDVLENFQQGFFRRGLCHTSQNPEAIGAGEGFGGAQHAGIASRQEGEGRALSASGEVAHDFHAVHIRHGEIAEDEVDVRVRPIQDRQGLAAVAGFKELRAADIREEARGHRADERLVIHQEHAVLRNRIRQHPPPQLCKTSVVRMIHRKGRMRGRVKRRRQAAGKPQ